MFKMYKTWGKVKDIFVKPSLKVYFGSWKKDPNLPVWRQGPIIYLCGKKNFFRKTHRVKNSVQICTGTKPFKWGKEEHLTKVYEVATVHKLPGKLKEWDAVWNSDIRRKLRKKHLSWIPPIIILPYWTTIKVFCWDVLWKTKYGEVRYEYPPQLSIIFFGLSLTFTLHCPLGDKYDDDYWESILIFLYNSNHTIEDAVKEAGEATITILENNTKYKYRVLSKEFLLPKWHNKYDKVVKDGNN